MEPLLHTSSRNQNSYEDRRCVDIDDDDETGETFFMRSSAHFHIRDGARWSLEMPQSNFYQHEEFLGQFTFCNYALFNLFRGILSPTEVSMVLMHALSSYTRVIFTGTVATFGSMNLDFENIREWIFQGEGEVETQQATFAAIEAWKGRLPGV